MLGSHGKSGSREPDVRYARREGLNIWAGTEARLSTSPSLLADGERLRIRLDHAHERLCLGAQLVARESEEFGRHEGLGWIDADVRRIQSTDGLRVPHVGWNEVHKTGVSALFEGIDDGALFYFVHSYHVDADDDALVKGVTDYGAPLTAVIERDNVYGTQFHPEKSQLAGLTLLRNFLTHA